MIPPIQELDMFMIDRGYEGVYHNSMNKGNYWQVMLYTTDLDQVKRLEHSVAQNNKIPPIWALEICAQCISLSHYLHRMFHWA